MRQSRKRFGTTSVIAPVDHHGRSSGKETARNLQPDAGSAAGNQRDSVLKIEHAGQRLLADTIAALCREHKVEIRDAPLRLGNELDTHAHARLDTFHGAVDIGQIDLFDVVRDG